MSRELLPTACAASPSEGELCRICQSDEEDQGPLLSPCNCDGSVRWVHAACLSEWRSKGGGPARRAAECELCGACYRYELVEATVSSAVTTSVYRAGDYVLCLLVQLSLGLAVSAIGGEVAWAMWVEPSGCLLALLAVLDTLPVCGLVTTHQWQSTWRTAQGRGVLLSALWAASMAARALLRGETTRAQAELFAQEEAAEQSEAAVALIRLLDESSSGRLALQVPGTLLPPQSQVASSTASAESSGSGHSDCAARAGVYCGQAVFFCGTHACLGVYWWCLKKGFGLEQLSLATRAAGTAGTVYWLVAIALLAVAAMMREPLRASCGADGLPQVRSLTDKERSQVMPELDI